VLRAFDVPAGTLGSATGISAAVHAGPRAVWLLTPQILFRFHNDGWSEVARASQPPGPFMPSLIEDASGSVWTGVGSGVLKVSAGSATGTPALRVFDEFAGFAGTVGGKPDGWPAAARSQDGRIWFATSRGLAVIDPARPGRRGPARTPRIDRVVADGRELQGEPRVDVPPGTTKLDIYYGALDLSAPQSIRFRYMLEGSDTGWVDAGTRREAFYTNLRPRTYTFTVNVSDRDGGWTDSSSTISLIVQPTFSQTTGFYVLIGCAALCAVGGAWWLRLRAVRNRFATILAERARVAREIHDTLLQNLGSVAVELEVVTHELAGAPPPAVETLRQLRRRVTESVREARESIEHLRSSGASSKGNLVNRLNELATAVSAGKDVEWTVASIGGAHRPVAPGVEEQLLRITREAVGNAIRHGHATRIAIELEYQKDTVLLSVTDDGCGFDPGDPASSTAGHWGIASMRERAASVGGSFNIMSRVGGGTQVEAVVPFQADSGPR
jgi:two-component sensor histidine kinase